MDFDNKFLKDKGMDLAFNEVIYRFKRMFSSKQDKVQEESGSNTFLKQKSSLVDKSRMINVSQRLT